MLNEPLPFTVNCVVKLNPEAEPVPPGKSALHTPVAVAGVVVLLLLPQALNMNATSSRTATSFMKCPLSSDGSKISDALFLLQDYRDAAYPVNGCKASRSFLTRALTQAQQPVVKRSGCEVEGSDTLETCHGSFKDSYCAFVKVTLLASPSTPPAIAQYDLLSQALPDGL